MSFAANALDNELGSRGYVVARKLGSERALDLAQRMGRVVCTTQVRLAPDVSSYLCSTGAVPLHTDHPRARYILWYCHEADAGSGANILVDGSIVIAGMDTSYQQQLAQINLPCPSLNAIQPGGQHRLWIPRRAQLFYAPWLVRGQELRADLAAFTTAIECAADARHEVQLRPGDALVVDNHRVLHGRHALEASSRRWLTRYWIEDLGSSRDTARADSADRGQAHLV